MRMMATGTVKYVCLCARTTYFDDQDALDPPHVYQAVGDDGAGAV